MKNRAAIRVMTIFGTRPEAIKLAPVIARLSSDERFQPIVAVTAQHREMLDQVLDIFHIAPEHDLDIMRPGQTLTDITTRALAGLTPLMEETTPDVVLVQGDTTTTFAGALAAFYHRVPVGHVEAGLRTNDLDRPFPEEANRRLTTRVTKWHFAPTDWARDNLLREAVPPGDVYVTGNTVVDALLQVVEQPYVFDNATLRAAIESKRRLILVTAHRRENWGAPFENICRALLEITRRFEDIHVLFATHKNPVVADVAARILGTDRKIDLIGPQEYLPFVNLMKHAYVILSDSGGVQEEAPTLGKPALVMRDVTERPEAVEAGVVKLVGTDAGRIVAEVSRLLEDREAYDAMARPSNPFGDGRAATRIADILARDC